MTIHQQASFDVEAAGLNATSKINPAVAKMVAAWENKNAKRAMQGSGLALMAMSLTACGGSDTPVVIKTATSEVDVTDLVVTAKAMDLTPDSDTGAAFTGTATADTFDGSRDIEGGQRFDTLNNADSLDGGLGVDTLNVALAGGVTVSPASLAGIEVINLQTDAANSVLSAVNSDSLTTVAFNNGSVAASVTNVPTLLSDVDITNNNGNNVTLTYANTAAAGTADALDVDLSGFTAANISISAAGGAGGYEAMTISSNGAQAQTITTLTVDAEVATLNVDGAQSLQITTAIAENVLTFNLATATAATSMGTADADSVVTYTGGKAIDTFDISVAGGLTTADVLNGGDGIDILRVEDGDVIALTAATAFTTITNFEHLFVDTALGGALRVDRVSTTINDVTLLAGPLAASSVAFAAGTAANVEINATTVGAFTIDDLGTGTADALTIDADMGGAVTLGGTLTVTDYETVTLDIPDGTITSSGAGITITPTAGTSATLLITGDSSLTMATGDVITASVIDASGMVMAATTDAGLVMTGAVVSVLGATITGSNGADTLFGTTTADVIIGGAGADIIVGGGGADRITTGSGNDVVRLTTNATTDSILDFTVGDAADQIEISEGDVDAFVQLTTGDGQDVTAGTGIDFASVANTDAVTLTGTDSIIKITNTTGINSNGDLVFNVTMNTKSATDGDGMLVLWYDADGGTAVLSTVVDTDSDGDTLINATNTTVADMATITMTATEYGNITAENFDFII